MSDQFIGEIRIFPFNFAPKWWAWCNGQLMPRAQNEALFSVLRTTYGGNGTTNFALPDLRGRAPMQWGQGPGLSLRTWGESGGSETVALSESEIPSHSHTLRAAQEPGELPGPSGRSLSRSAQSSAYQTNAADDLTNMPAQSLAPAGGNASHNNMQPYLTFHFCIALAGIFPPRQ